jgi:hypothetical protein
MKNRVKMEVFMSDCRSCGFIKQRNRDYGCKHCPTSRVIKKMKDTVTRVKKRFQDLWTSRKKRG